MVSTSTGSFAARLSSTLRVISLVLISPTFAAGPLETFFFKSSDDNTQVQEEPVRDFFVKDNTAKPKPKRKTPIRDFFIKETDTEQDEAIEDNEPPPQSEPEEEEQWECDCHCGCCN